VEELPFKEFEYRRPLQSRFGPEGPARGGDVERGKFTRRSFLVAGASALVAGSAWGQVNGDRPIILGQVSLSFYAVTGAVVHEVLKRLGHSVEVRQGPHEEHCAGRYLDLHR
jgi:hypothetical protein